MLAAPLLLTGNTLSALLMQGRESGGMGCTGTMMVPTVTIGATFIDWDKNASCKFCYVLLSVYSAIIEMCLDY